MSCSRTSSINAKSTKQTPRLRRNKTVSVSFIDQVPVRIGTKEEFERVAEVFQQASFDEGTICRKLRLKDMSDTGWLRNDQDVSPQLRILIRLFFQSALAPRAEVEQVF